MKIQQRVDGLMIGVRVQPGAKRSAVLGLHGDAVKIAVAAPPVEGKANKVLVEFLCETLHLKKSQVAILAGEKSRNKQVLIAGITSEQLLATLANVK